MCILDLYFMFCRLLKFYVHLESTFAWTRAFKSIAYFLNFVSACFLQHARESKKMKVSRTLVAIAVGIRSLLISVHNIWKAESVPLLSLFETGNHLLLGWQRELASCRVAQTGFAWSVYRASLSGTVVSLRIYRILHSWSFHMKFMKQAFGEFHKFYMKWPRVYDSVYHRALYNEISSRSKWTLFQ